MTEVEPGLRDRVRIDPTVKTLELFPEVPRGSSIIGIGDGLLARFGTINFPPGVANPIERRLCLAPSRHEPHRARLVEVEIGDIERASFEENFSTPEVTRALRSQVDRDDTTIGPVERKECLPPRRGKMAASPELHPCGRSAAHIIIRWHIVRRINGKAARVSTVLMPAVVRPGNEMINPCRTIERQPHVALIIRIIGKSLAVGIEVDTVGIAKTAVHRLPHDLAINDSMPDPVTELLRSPAFGWSAAG